LLFEGCRAKQLNGKTLGSIILKSNEHWPYMWNSGDGENPSTFKFFYTFYIVFLLDLDEVLRSPRAETKPNTGR